MMPTDRETYTYLSTNTADAYDLYDPTNAIFAASNLQTINPASLPAHSLTLRVGMPVMCMQNLDVPNGICNGTVMVVERLESSVAWCRVNTRFGQRLHPIAPTNFVYNHNGFKFTRTQLPLRIAFCVTINRAQGGTYERVALHSVYPIWAHGMLYTAITRVTTDRGLSILCNPELRNTFDGEMYATMRNVVHPRVSGRTEDVNTAAQNPAPPRLPGPTQDAADDDANYGSPEFEFYNRDA